MRKFFARPDLIAIIILLAGCASENIYLQAVSFGPGTVFIGAFHDDEVREVLQLGADA